MRAQCRSEDYSSAASTTLSLMSRFFQQCGALVRTYPSGLAHLDFCCVLCLERDFIRSEGVKKRRRKRRK